MATHSSTLACDRGAWWATVTKSRTDWARKQHHVTGFDIFLSSDCTKHCLLSRSPLCIRTTETSSGTWSLPRPPSQNPDTSYVLRNPYRHEFSTVCGCEQHSIYRQVTLLADPHTERISLNLRCSWAATPSHIITKLWSRPTVRHTVTGLKRGCKLEMMTIWRKNSFSAVWEQLF